jgi:two-component system OmpR family sensor kinase/two-component system sensor histidine kinase BaeS
MNLYQKGLLAFAAVILIAVLTVAWLVGLRAEAEFRSYTVLYSNRAQMLASTLETYYAAHGSWAGLQATAANLSIAPGGGPGRQQGREQGSSWHFRVADRAGRIVADSQRGPADDPSGALSRTARQQALPLVVSDVTVGYLMPASVHEVPLGEPEERFLDKIVQALLLAALVAFLAALLLAGVLTRGIVAPVRALTHAAERIAAGELDTRVRARPRSQDEIAHLAATFNAMAADLQRAEEARRAQTADIAHELRNPLAVLQGTLEALADGIYAATEENIEPALDQVRTLNRLVEDLRTLALADAGQLHLELQALALGPFLARVVDAHRDTLAERGIALKLALDEHVPPVAGDVTRLTQVVNNILGNAARYLPAGAEVRVTLAAAEGGARVQIADNGPGVAPGDLAHLFDRFWRAEPSRNRATGGSGLGLAIVQQIVAAHGGRVAATATPGGGLTLTFWLPAHAATSQYNPNHLLTTS